MLAYSYRNCEMKYTQQAKLIALHGADKIIRALSPYLTTRRKNRIAAVISGRLNSIQLAIEAPSDINNALACIRSCEALGVADVHIIAPEGDAKAARSITQGAVYWVNTHFYSSLDEFQSQKPQNMQLAGALMNAQLTLTELPLDQPLCLMLGNEQRGLSESAKEACDLHYRIPMYGMSESLNLSVSAAISLYNTTERKRHNIQTSSDLNEQQRQTLKAQYYLNSLEPRLINGLLK